MIVIHLVLNHSLAYYFVINFHMWRMKNKSFVYHVRRIRMRSACRRYNILSDMWNNNNEKSCNKTVRIDRFEEDDEKTNMNNEIERKAIWVSLKSAGDELLNNIYYFVRFKPSTRLVRTKKLNGKWR